MAFRYPISVGLLSLVVALMAPPGATGSNLLPQPTTAKEQLDVGTFAVLQTEHEEYPEGVYAYVLVENDGATDKIEHWALKGTAGGALGFVSPGDSPASRRDVSMRFMYRGPKTTLATFLSTVVVPDFGSNYTYIRCTCAVRTPPAF